MVDTPREALELFGSAPIDALVLGPHLVRRAALFDPGSTPGQEDG
jgi:carbamoyltransferase